MWLKTNKAAKLLGVHPNTLRNWDRENKIKTMRTPKGHRLYNINSLVCKAKDKVIYARVSSASQKDDLQSQIRQLRQQFPEHILIKDVGSGLNFKRKGFKFLLEQVTQGMISEIVIAHKDRLCRFGFELINWLCKQNNCNILVLNDTSLSPQEELVKDLVSIIHVFSCRMYGLRKYSSKISKDKELYDSNQNTLQ